MPVPRLPVPAVLGDAFTSAAARDAGMGRGPLRHTARVTRGVRAVAAPVSLADRCRALGLALPPEASFSHTTAARLHELWLPGLPTEDVEVLVPPGVRPPRRAGVTAHVGRSEVMSVRGLRVVRPPEVFAQLADRLDLRALVILGDSVVRWRSPWTVADLQATLVLGARGVRRARRALGLVREGSNSARESLVRIVLVDAGLPEPELNGAVVIGGRREYADLLWRDAKVVGEYHGAYHYATDAQRLADIDRGARFRREGWTVIEVTRTHLTSRGTADRVVEEFARALGVSPLPRQERGRTYRER